MPAASSKSFFPSPCLFASEQGSRITDDYHQLHVPDKKGGDDNLPSISKYKNLQES